MDQESRGTIRTKRRVMMDLEMVLNELSLRSPAHNVQTARQWMSGFISTVQKATKHGVKKVVRTEYNLRSTLLSYENGYTVGRWLKDDEVDQVARNFFLGLVTPEPFLSDIIDEEIKSKFDSFQFWHQEDEAKGLGVAFMIEALAVSFKSEERWYPSRLELKVNQLDDNGEIISTYEELVHASHEDHIQEHIGWIQQHSRAEIHDGLDIWNHKEELFPNLQFCESVGEQMANLLHGDIRLQPIVKRLYELENYCSSWHEGPFDVNGFFSKVSLESGVTLRRYGPERTFVCPDGIGRLFKWHVRLTPGACPTSPEIDWVFFSVWRVKVT